MFMPASTFSRLTTAVPIADGSVMTSCRTPSIAVADSDDVPFGSSVHVGVRGRAQALGDDEVDTWTTGAARRLGPPQRRACPRGGRPPAAWIASMWRATSDSAR
jgi:hypothetical protein